MTGADLDFFHFFFFNPAKQTITFLLQICGTNQASVYAAARSHIYPVAVCVHACQVKVNCMLACSPRLRANLLSYPLLHFRWEAQLIAFCSVCTCHRKIDYGCSIDPPPHTAPPAPSSYENFIIPLYYDNVFGQIDLAGAFCRVLAASFKLFRR